jgi:hypothetical protein
MGGQCLRAARFGRQTTRNLQPTPSVVWWEEIAALFCLRGGGLEKFHTDPCRRLPQLRPGDTLTVRRELSEAVAPE